MMLSVFALPLEVLAAEQAVITILHTNDVHGNEEDEKVKTGCKLAFVDSKPGAILLDAGYDSRNHFCYILVGICS